MSVRFRTSERGRAPRALFLGMASALSLTALEALLAAGVEVCGVVVPAPAGAPALRALPPEGARSPLPLANPHVERSILHVAWERGIPAFELARPGDPAALAALAALGAEVGCVACFTRRLPGALLQLPPLGFLNVHPSLLPMHRGPAPLFWTLRAGDQAGVTVHFLDEGLDTGDIALQEPVALPDGATAAEADALCGHAGGRMLAEALVALGRGDLARRAQGEGGSYEPWPEPGDFLIDAGWPARRAYNFMRGTADWGVPYRLVGAGPEHAPPLLLREALGYEADGTLPAPFVLAGDTLLVRCAPGVLRARIEAAGGA